MIKFNATNHSGGINWRLLKHPNIQEDPLKAREFVRHRGRSQGEARQAANPNPGLQKLNQTEQLQGRTREDGGGWVVQQSELRDFANRLDPGVDLALPVHQWLSGPTRDKIKTVHAILSAPRQVLCVQLPTKTRQHPVIPTSHRNGLNPVQLYWRGTHRPHQHRQVHVSLQLTSVRPKWAYLPWPIRAWVYRSH